MLGCYIYTLVVVPLAMAFAPGNWTRRADGMDGMEWLVDACFLLDLAGGFSTGFNIPNSGSVELKWAPIARRSAKALPRPCL